MFNTPIRDNNSLLSQSSVRFSLSAFNESITLKETFPRSFNKIIWYEISKHGPRQFKSQQEKVLHILLNDEEKFLTHFRLFYNNHLIIYEWHVLASQKHLQIKDYVFTKLLKTSCADYKDILRDNINKLAKSSIKKQHSRHSPNFFLRSSNHTPNPSSVIQIKKSQSLPNSIHYSPVLPKPFSSEGHQQSSQDYHALFIKTLDACDGFKYIHYDFCKHQKGYENRNVYNRFIRIKRRNNSCQRLNTFYEESKEEQAKQNKERNRKNLFNQTLSCLKPSAVYNGSKYAKFELIPFDINESKSLNRYESQNKRNIIKSRVTKIHVMKKMPHQFGKQKKSTAFLIKTHKSPVLVQPVRS